MDNDDDGWENLVGPAQFDTPVEMRLSEFCTAAQEGDIEKVFGNFYNWK